MVEDKQVTAVWFLIKELSDKIAFTPGSELALWHAQLYERALAMEREQIIAAANNGCKGFCMIDTSRDGKHYYKETYGGQDE
jgi:hypothetical protein